MPRDAFVLKIQRELCHPKYARKVSGLSRNSPQDRFVVCELTVSTQLVITMFSPFHYSYFLAGPI